MSDSAPAPAGPASPRHRPSRSPQEDRAAWTKVLASSRHDRRRARRRRRVAGIAPQPAAQPTSPRRARRPGGRRQIGAIDGGVNMLLVGSDSREGQGGIGDGPTTGVGAQRRDDAPAHLAGPQSVTVVSFPRDMFVPLPGVHARWLRRPARRSTPPSPTAVCPAPCYGREADRLSIQFAGHDQFNGVIDDVECRRRRPRLRRRTIKDQYTGSSSRRRHARPHGLRRPRVPPHPSRRRRRQRPQPHQLAAGVPVVARAQDQERRHAHQLGKLYAIAKAATKNITLSENFTHLDTLVSVALVLKNIPLETTSSFVQYPGTTGVRHLLGQGRADPVAREPAVRVIKADKPFGARRQASTAIPRRSRPTSTRTRPDATPTPTSDQDAQPGKTRIRRRRRPRPSRTADAVPVLAGVKGQTAAQYTCSQPYQY